MDQCNVEMDLSSLQNGPRCPFSFEYDIGLIGVLIAIHTIDVTRRRSVVAFEIRGSVARLPGFMEHINFLFFDEGE